jgi:glycosyltransferase involved in cell wall biosynthesis
MKASVAITTYNQARFIGQAIDSALWQRTNFDFEVLVGEDGSTDQTRDIVCAYAREHPTRIRAILRDENVGIWRNFAGLYHSSQGEYFALLDGDDYWTDPDKLQRQVDFLDAHPDYSMCFHSAMMVWEDASHPATPHFPPDRKHTYSLEELLVHDFITASSVVVRNKLFGEFPEWFWRTPVQDWPFLALNARHGKIGYLDECWSVYRQHSAGVYCGLPLEKRIEQHIQLGRIFLEAFAEKHHAALRQALANRLLRLALLHHRAGCSAQSRELARQYLRESSSNPLMRLRNRAKLAVYKRSPALHKFVSTMRSRHHECMVAPV